MQSSSKNILVEWLDWHFLEVPKFLLQVWKNYILFALNYFSFIALIKTFFAPWRRYRWNYPKLINFGDFLATFISNVFSRLMGAIMRIFLILVGFVFQISIIIIGAATLFLWMMLPFILIFLILYEFLY